MDTSPEYVKMCKQATEIQSAWEPALGDWHSSITEDGTPYTSPICLVGGIITGFYRNDIWLPRQDQLQEMVGIYTPTDLYEAFVHHGSVFLAGAGVKDGIGWRFWRPNTLEQMFLAFLMDKKYGKKWTGTEWST